MPRIYDKAYVVSVSKYNFGRIVAYCGDSADGVIGKDLFDYLGMHDDDERELKESIASYGKDGYATAGFNGRWHAVFFFKDFAYDTGLCLALVLAVSARAAAEAISDGVFGGFFASERLLRLAKKKSGMAMLEHSDECLHLSRVFGQIMEVLKLKIEHSAQPTENIRDAARAMCEIAKTELDFFTYFSHSSEELAASAEIFDGRLCAASIIVFAMLASRFSVDSRLNVVVVRGMGAVRLCLSFKKRSDGWQYPFEYLKNMACANHSILFEDDEDPDTVGVSFVPFYQDPSFVGVKNGEELFDFVEQMELR